MLGSHGRGLARSVFTPPARVLAKAGVTPNQVTVASTILNTIAAVTLLATGHLVIGVLVLAVILFADSLDGTLARLTGGTSKFGSFLDATLDRIADGAVFGSLVYWIATSQPAGGMRTWLLITGLVTVVTAATVPYARARAEAVGATANVGIAEGTDRLLIALTCAFFVGVGLPLWILGVGLTWTATASSITVVQRVLRVKKELGA